MKSRRLWRAKTNQLDEKNIKQAGEGIISNLKRQKRSNMFGHIGNDGVVSLEERYASKSLQFCAVRGKREGFDEVNHDVRRFSAIVIRTAGER